MSNIRSLCSLLLQIVWLVALSEGWLFSNNNCFRSPNVGCFPTSRPFTNTMGFAPLSPQDVDVNFIHRGTHSSLRFTLEQTQREMQSRFNPSLKTVVIIHGYMETYTRRWVSRMVSELQRQGPMNIFLVDWAGGAFHLIYFQCVANARMAGAVTALFLQEFINLGASPSSFHIIGFSLGAHVAGYAGSRLPGIGRITGLDPAGPGFLGTHPAVHLDPTDALVVDVVHTDTDLGALMPFGTLDFYPNGGTNQPMCGSGAIDRLSSLMATMDFSRNSVTRTFGCSHIRATELFTSSINNACVFAMKHCQNVSDMRVNRGSTCRRGTCPTFGYHLDNSRTPRPGIYRFSTRGTHPFC